MDTNRIIADIDTEISKLQQVRALLSNVETNKKGGLSAKGRAAISAAMKARWAKAKKTAKKATKTTASPPKTVKTARVR